MTKIKLSRRLSIVLAFSAVFSFSFITAVLITLSAPSQIAAAAPPAHPELQTTTYAGSQACANCHQNLHTSWQTTLHSKAFSSPIFQRDWSELSKQTSCLQCHTTGFDPKTGSYAEQGVTCEACHGAFQPGHPTTQMPLEPNADLCATCHKNTTDEWRASPHSAANIQCQSCHNPHSQTPMANSITELCTNCHKQFGDSFTHSTHSNVGLECSNCHMYTPPRSTSPIGGLVATGHTFSVGSEACIGCHQDTVHTRDKLLQLGGGTGIPTQAVDVEELNKTIRSQEEAISSLRNAGQARLYTGLIQGAIIGLVTGGAAAWVVSRRIRIIEVDENE